MSIDDFDRLLPEELNAVLMEHHKYEESRYSGWLMGVRLHAAITIQPYCKGTVRPKELFKIPGIDTEAGWGGNHEPPMTKEERRRRLHELKKARGYG
ncbi:MAG: hypothetical protein NC204_05585 [Candidatus Amulumruptor caecigallinarius]|nr:hypothetical protein [Candidatus Amulumruptor caecigallinarius]